MRSLSPAHLPPIARLLGLAGLMPQALVLAVVLFGGPDVRFTALSLGYGYAALILSFLGGLWWGLAAADSWTPSWVWGAAVVPTLLALATAWPWATGGTWPEPSLIVLGVLILASVAVDLKLKAIGIAPDGWISLRLPLSVGLGLLTILTGLV